jgi:CCR4-NOT transcription complex subunit 1
MVNSTRGGTFSPAQQSIVTGNHSPHGSHHSTFSAGASPSTNSPTGSNSLTKIVVAQVYLLLSTIKDDKDNTKWEQQAEQLRKVCASTFFTADAPATNGNFVADR